MKIRKILLAALAVSTFLVAVSSNSTSTVIAATAGETSAEAKCAIPPFARAYADAKAIFTGKVLSVAQNDRGKTFEFQVEKYWKGSKSKKVKVTVYETPRFQAFYQAGKRYLVFAGVEDDGNLTDGRCSRSVDIASAAADLKALGKAKKPR